MSSIKWELKTCVLLETSGVITLLRVITLKTSFLSCPWIFFCLDVDSWVSAYLLAILTYSRCILGYMWLDLADDESAKDTDRSTSIVLTGIRNTYVRDTYIGNTYNIGT